jgi:hypothetical protein
MVTTDNRLADLDRQIGFLSLVTGWSERKKLVLQAFAHGPTVVRLASQTAVR